MIKFFRNIRQKLVTEGKTINYLKYAIGEIVLVVIGILIALQVNNWNENRKEQLLEQRILINLKQEYNENLKALNQSIVKRQSQLSALNTLLKFIDLNQNDQIDKKLDSIIGISRYIPNFEARNGVLNDILNSGELSIIKNEKLRNILSNWSGELEDLTRRENGQENIILSQYNVYLINNYSTRNSDNFIVAQQFEKDTNMDVSWRTKPLSKNESENYKELLSDKKFESIVSIVNMWAISGQIAAKSLEAKIKNVIDLIDNEINP
jgi:hypothetical protein